MTIKKAVTKKAPKTKEIAKTDNMSVESLIKMALNKNSSIEVMERLLAMRQKLRDEQAEIEFRSAMSEFQGRCPVINKKKIVKSKSGAERYRYAPLEDVVSTIQPILFDCKLSYDIDTEITTEPNGIKVQVEVFHIFGYSKKSSFWVPVDPDAYMTDQQKWASAQTYAKRYAFCNAFGILTGDEDNDTNIPVMTKTSETTKENPAINKQLQALPDIIKEGFRNLGYTRKAVIIFCTQYKWSEDAIKRELNKIADGGKK